MIDMPVFDESRMIIAKWLVFNVIQYKYFYYYFAENLILKYFNLKKLTDFSSTIFELQVSNSMYRLRMQKIKNKNVSFKSETLE